MLLRDQNDVELMSDTGLEVYRFSISWSRLVPRGRGPVNPKGLEYYTDLITEITKRGRHGRRCSLDWRLCQGHWLYWNSSVAEVMCTNLGHYAHRRCQRRRCPLRRAPHLRQAPKAQAGPPPTASSTSRVG